MSPRWVFFFGDPWACSECVHDVLGSPPNQQSMSGYTSDPRIRPQEFLPWIIAIAAFFLLPEYLSLGARVLVYILFALSLDLILGYAGIITLGHSAFFGLGAYTAGFLGWSLIRRLIDSPFCAMLTGIRENTARMHAVGAPVYWRLVLVYTLSATLAGIAGALLTQVNQFVGLNVLGLEPSGDLLVMLILGGVGRLYGAFVGPIVYLIAQDYLAKQYPEYWYLGIGVLLIVVVLFVRGGILGILDKWLQALSRQTGSARASAR